MAAARPFMRQPLSSSVNRTVFSSLRTTQRSFGTARCPCTPLTPCNRQSSRAAIKSSIPKTQLQQTFRRSYADSVSLVTKRRGRGFFRWTWRLTYVSAIGGVGYLAYNIYLLRSPSEQYNPDPSKKTLVVLGKILRGDLDSPIEHF